MMRMLKIQFSNQRPRPFRAKSRRGLDIPEGVIITFDSPLLDITKTVQDTSILQKYSLANDAAIIATEKHFPLFEELSKMKDVVYSAGGSGQNAMRIFQWIVGKPFCAYFVGAIGRDKVGKRMAKEALCDGIRTVYQVKDRAPTGTCAVIVNGVYRSLVANLGASAYFSEDWLDNEEHQCFMNRAKYFYVTGYFVEVNAATALRVAQISYKNDCTFLLNFSSVEVIKNQKNQLDDVLCYTDLIIGNKQEVLAYADSHGWKTTCIPEIGKRLQCLPKYNGRPRTVLITDAQYPVFCFQENQKLLVYPVPRIKKSAIVDTTGCGDAFVGGLLSQLVQHKSLDQSIRTAIFAAQQVLCIVGVQINQLPKFKEVC